MNAKAAIVTRTLMARHGYTVRSLSERTGVSNSTISKLRSGNVPGNISYDVLRRLGEVLEATPDQLMGIAPVKLDFDGDLLNSFRIISQAI